MFTYCWQEVCRNEALKLETEAKAASEEAAWWWLQLATWIHGGSGGMLQTIVKIFKRFGDVLDFASIFWFPVQEQWTTDQRPSLEARP